MTSGPTTRSPAASVQAGWEVGLRETREIALVSAFIDAWDAGRVDDASRLLTDDVQFSDCDYAKGEAVVLTGRVAVSQWLTARAADKDQLTIASVFNDNPTAGAGVVGISYSLRTSRTLASLGRPNGIQPQVGTKVVFSDDDRLIRAFVNGPGGGDPSLCRP